MTNLIILPANAHWNKEDLAGDNKYQFPEGTIAFEVWGIAGGGGGGGNGHCDLIGHHATGWGGGAGSGGFTHIKYTDLNQKYDGHYIEMDGKPNAGSGGKGVATSGTSRGNDGTSASSIPIETYVRTIWGGIHSNKFTVYGGYAGGCGQAGPDGVDNHGAGGSGGAGASCIEGTVDTTFGAGNSGTSGADLTQGIGGVTNAGTKTFDIYPSWDINLNNYGSGGNGDPEDSATSGCNGVAGIFTVVYCVEYTASASVSSAGGGTVSVTKSSGIIPNENVTFTATPDTGYTFVRWDDGTTNPTYTVTVTSNISLVATFARLYILSLHYNDETTPTSTIYIGSGQTYNLPTPPSRATYTFTGWYSDEACTIRVATAYIMPAHDQDLYVGWSCAIDDNSIVLVIDSGGGTFDTNNDVSGVVAITYPVSPFATPAIRYTADKLIWTYNAPSTELEIRATVNLAALLNNFILPGGIDSLDKYELLIPYQVLYPSSDSKYNNVITFKRNTQDSICRYVAYPRWIPSRDGDQRCVITMPGQPSLDFGNIQSITETYTSSLSTIPVVCKGYSGSFCMDTGVSKKITVNYTRVSPVLPIESSTDSRQWSNAHWIKILKEYTDRWQMRTNGCLLYIVRPNKNRLKDSSENDPMAGYYTEVNGENAYISSAPVKYDTTSTHILHNSVSFTVGTLYPQSSPVPMHKVTYHAYGYGETASLGADVELYYPENTPFVLPECFVDWPLKFDYTTEKWMIWANWKNADGTTSYNPGDVISISSDIDMYSNVEKISVEGKTAKITHGTYKFTATKITAGAAAKVYFVLNGAGGGGAGYTRCTWNIPNQSVGYEAWIGGGGGASGTLVTRNFTLEASSCSITVTCGAGGSAGQDWKSTSAATAGGAGGDTIVYIDDAAIAYARGGSGGSVGVVKERDLVGHSVICEGGVGGQNGSYSGGRGGNMTWKNTSQLPPTVLEDGEEGKYSPSIEQGHPSGYGGRCEYSQMMIRGATSYTYYTGGGGGAAPQIVEPTDEYGMGTDYWGGQTKYSGYSAISPTRGGGGAGGGFNSQDTTISQTAQAGADGYVYILPVNIDIDENTGQ